MKSKKNFAEKPYNRCLFCPKRLSSPPECNGPRTGSMTTDRWREYMRDIKDIDGLTFEAIAERTNGQMSAPSIQNVLAPGATGELTRERARIIENAMFGVTIADPCPIDLLEGLDADTKKVQAVETQMAELRRNIELVHSSYRQEMDTIRAEAQAKIDYLKKDNERLHKIIDRLLQK